MLKLVCLLFVYLALDLGAWSVKVCNLGVSLVNYRWYLLVGKLHSLECSPFHKISSSPWGFQSTAQFTSSETRAVHVRLTLAWGGWSRCCSLAAFPPPSQSGPSGCQTWGREDQWRAHKPGFSLSDLAGHQKPSFVKFKYHLHFHQCIQWCLLSQWRKLEWSVWQSDRESSSYHSIHSAHKLLWGRYGSGSTDYHWCGQLNRPHDTECQHWAVSATFLKSRNSPHNCTEIWSHSYRYPFDSRYVTVFYQAFPTGYKPCGEKARLWG